MRTKSDRLRDACEKAVVFFKTVNSEQFSEIISKLEYCIGSYNFDKNPSGLIEYGQKAAEILREMKKAKTARLPKTLLKNLEDNLI